MQAQIALLVSDVAVLSSLQFVLSVEGFELATVGDDLATCAALVIDQEYQTDGLAALRTLREGGNTVPVILLATNPTRVFRARVASADAIIIEKPLLGDALSDTIFHVLQPWKAASR